MLLFWGPERVQFYNDAYRTSFGGEGGRPPSTLGTPARETWEDVQGVKQRIQEQAELLDRAQDAILVRDMDQRIVYWNRAAERIYGWSQDEVVGRSIRELLYRDPAPFDEATACVLQDGEWSGEVEHVNRSGVVLAVEGRWSLLRDAEGRPHRILSINTDVTERKRLLAQFLRAQRMESIGTLAGGIAHDLNNVLSPILLSIGLLREEVDDPMLQEVLATIEGSARRGADMVQQVLGFARGFDRSDVRVDVPRIVGDVVRVTRDTFPRNIEVRSELTEAQGVVVGDPTQVHQVFLNLLVNARDAMPDGGVITVRTEGIEVDESYAAMLSGAEPGAYLRITVEDTGQGMPPEVVAKAFDPFFTTKEVGKGTGLGLSTVDAIARGHGGFVNLYSEVGAGTTVRIYLPTREPGSEANEGRVDRVLELPRGNGELILVVDDEGSVRNITRQTLETFGYRVLTATDGADAVAAYGRHGEEIALVLTDMVMPIMDGPTTIRALKRMNAGVRIIGASGLGANGGVARAADSGVRYFLPKPYTAESLLIMVAQVLEGPEGK
jgi:PAS domain S-box-containing protein